MLFGRAEPHDRLNDGTVIPRPVKQDDFTGRRQMRHIALEVPLGLFAVGGFGQSDDPPDARVHPPHDGLDEPALAGRVATFKNDRDLQAFALRRFLQLGEFKLEISQFFCVAFLLHEATTLPSASKR